MAASAWLVHKDSANQIQGVSEETTTGVNRLYQTRTRMANFRFPAINVNDSCYQVEIR